LDQVNAKIDIIAAEIKENSYKTYQAYTIAQKIEGAALKERTTLQGKATL